MAQMNLIADNQCF